MTRESGFGFGRTCRLRAANEFRHVFRRGIKSTHPYFLVIRAANGLNHARLGLAISKKHLARAPDRNRAKRVIREFFRLHLRRDLPYDLVFISRPALAKAPANVLFAALDDCRRALLAVTTVVDASQ